MKRPIYAGIFLLAILMLATAGTKLSQMRRTTTLKSNDLFMVVRTTDGKRTNFTIETRYLGPELGPYITNSGSGSGGSGDALTNNETRAVQFLGSLLVTGRQTNNEAVRLNDDITQTAGLNADFAFLSANTLDVNGTNITAVIHAMGTNTIYTSNELYSLIVASGISAPTATNIARFWATNAALTTSNQLINLLALKTNPTLYGSVTIDSGTANELVAFSAGKVLTSVSGVDANEAAALDGIDSNIQDQIDATPGSVSPQGFRLSNRLLERIADWRHAGMDFYDSFEREGLTNYPGTSDSGHIWGHAPIGTTTNLVWIGNGRFRHATNGPTGPHYWGVTRTNLSVNWGWFGGTVMYEGLGNNGWEDTATIILCRSLDFNTSQPYLHFRVLRTGLQVQLSQTNNLINETYPIPLTNNVFYTFNCYVHGNRLIAQVGNNRYEVTHDSLAQESITNATVLIYEHNRRTTNITSGWYASYGDAWAGALPFDMYRYMTDGIYRGSNGVINSITFADGTTQSTAGGSGGGGAGSLPANSGQLSTNTTLTIISGAVVTNISARGLTIPQITASRALIVNGSGDVTNSPGVTSTELEYLDGVTSAIQTQLGGKQNGQTNANQFGASTTITLKDGLIVTNLQNVGTLSLTNGTGQSLFAQQSYQGDAFALARRTNAPAATGTTNFVEVAQGASVDQVLSIHSVSSGQITWTNKTVTSSGSLGETNPVVMYRDNAILNMLATATETTNFQYTIPADQLGTNRVFRFTIGGIITNHTGNNRTFRLRVYFGSTTLFDHSTAAIPTANTNAWRVSGELVANDSTSAQSVHGLAYVSQTSTAPSGTGLLTTDELLSFTPFYGEGTEDTTADKRLVITITPSNADFLIRRRIGYGVLE